MEVYVDEMLVKSKVASNHITHLVDTFNILRTYRLKLNTRLSVHSAWPLENSLGSCSTSEA